MVESFPNLIKNVILYTQETLQIPSRMTIKRSTRKCVIVKIMEDKEKNLESGQRKNVPSHTWEPTANFSSETMTIRRQQDYIFKVMKEKNINQESYICQNYISKGILKERHSHTTESLLRVDSIYKKTTKINSTS